MRTAYVSLVKLFNVLSSLLVACSAVAGPAYPLKAVPGQHHVVDQNNAPFFIQGDSPWYIVQKLQHSDMEYYLSNRWVQGFNCILFAPNEGTRSDAYGNVAWINSSGGYTDLSSVNPNFWTNVDWLIQRAGSYGICAFVFPLYDGYNGAQPDGMYSDMANASSNTLWSYGHFIGNRYKDFTNIVWVGAGDFNEPNAPTNCLWNIVASGIRSADTNHLFTALGARINQAIYYSDFVTLNSTYSGVITYTNSLNAYQRTPVMPSFLQEGFYENRNITGTPFGALDCRRFAWWAVLSGDSGNFFGNEYLYPFATGWQDEMWSPGTTSMTNVIRLMNSRPWYNCIPDVDHSVVTSGYGTWGSGNYISATREATGKTVMAYIPGYIMAPTVDMTNISGSTANAWWFNPRTGAATAIGTFSTTGPQTFTPPDVDDWVLVLDDAAQNFGPPGERIENTLQIQTANLAAGTVGVVYLANLTASGGTEPYSWSVVSNALPPGLALSTNGLLSGTPTAAGTNGFTIQVSDAGNQAKTAAFQMAITDLVVALTSPQQTADEISETGFRIFMSSNVPGSYLIQWTPDFVLWQAVQTVQYTNGRMEVLDPGASNSAFRFYRAGLSSNEVANPPSGGRPGSRGK